MLCESMLFPVEASEGGLVQRIVENRGFVPNLSEQSLEKQLPCYESYLPAPSKMK